MRVSYGKKEESLAPEAFADLVAGHEQIHVDLGTGDGLYVLHEAREHPTHLVIGLDAAGDNLRKTAAKSRRKAAKGGAPNALFVVSAVEALPDCLKGTAHRITVNYPWGSLLRAVTLPDPVILAGMKQLGKAGTRVDMLINTHIFNDPDYLERLEMPSLDETYLHEVLLPAYSEAGFAFEEHRFFHGPSPHRTTWGQRLIKGSNRGTLALHGHLL